MYDLFGDFKIDVIRKFLILLKFLNFVGENRILVL